MMPIPIGSKLTDGRAERRLVTRNGLPLDLRERHPEAVDPVRQADPVGGRWQLLYPDEHRMLQVRGPVVLTVDEPSLGSDNERRNVPNHSRKVFAARAEGA